METTALILGMIVSVLAILAFMFKVSQWLMSIRRVIEKELTNNGGGSMKDKLERIERKVDAVTKAQLETHALVMGHERELGGLQVAVKDIKENQ